MQYPTQAICIAIVATLGFSKQDGADSEVARVRRLELISGDGRTLAVLGETDDGAPHLSFYNKTRPEKPIWDIRVLSTTEASGAVMSFCDRDGYSRLSMGVYDDGRPMILTLDRSGTPCIQLLLTGEKENPELLLGSPSDDGRERVRVGLTPSGNSGLLVVSAGDGDVVWSSPGTTK